MADNLLMQHGFRSLLLGFLLGLALGIITWFQPDTSRKPASFFDGESERVLVPREEEGSAFDPELEDTTRRFKGNNP